MTRVVCRRCAGEGFLPTPGGNATPCKNCNGEGTIELSGSNEQFLPESMELARDLQKLPAIALTLSGVEAFALVAQLQLALRHPGNTGRPAAIAQRIVEELARRIGTTPRIRETIADGFDPAKDVGVMTAEDLALTAIGLGAAWTNAWARGDEERADKFRVLAEKLGIKIEKGPEMAALLRRETA